MSPISISRMKRVATLALVLLLVACGGRRPPPPAPVPPPAPPPGPPPFTATEVWTRERMALRNDSSPAVPLPHTFMRLEVLRVDSAGLFVRCAVCRGTPTGWVDSARVAYQVRSPADAAKLELADFALAVREAVRRRDIPALQQVMARDFVSSHFGPESVLEAVAAWRRCNYTDLDRVPYLLDRGIVNLPGTPVWAAPPEYASSLLYMDLRTGFRRGPNGWEWIFLVRPGLL